MKKEKNLFREWKEIQLLASKCCKVTESGRVLWNQGIVIELIERLGIYYAVFQGRPIYLQYLEDRIKETNFEEIKDLILDRMNQPESQKERMHLIRNNVFFSEDLLKNLKEAIPDFVHDNSLEFGIGTGYFTVKKDEIFMHYYE